MCSGDLQVVLAEECGEKKIKQVFAETEGLAHLVQAQHGRRKEVFGDAAAESIQKVRKASRPMRAPQGRVEKKGTLIGFQSPFGPPKPHSYSVRAYTRSTFLSISRDALAEVIRKHPGDAIVFMQAMQHAENTLVPKRRASPSEAALEGNGAPQSQRRYSHMTSMSSNQSYGSSRSSSLGLDLSDSVDRTKLTREAMQAGWLPNGASTETEGTSPGWIEAREMAERELNDKMDVLAGQVQQLGSAMDLLGSAVSDIKKALDA